MTRRNSQNFDFSKPVATHIYVNGIKSNRKNLAKAALDAMARISQCPQGTVAHPLNLASALMPDGRSLIKTIYQDGYVMYNDGWFVVEYNSEGFLYVDVTKSAEIRNAAYRNIERITDEYTR